MTQFSSIYFRFADDTNILCDTRLARQLDSSLKQSIINVIGLVSVWGQTLEWDQLWWHLRSGLNFPQKDNSRPLVTLDKAPDFDTGDFWSFSLEPLRIVSLKHDDKGLLIVTKQLL